MSRLRFPATDQDTTDFIKQLNILTTPLFLKIEWEERFITLVQPSALTALTEEVRRDRNVSLVVLSGMYWNLDHFGAT